MSLSLGARHPSLDMRNRSARRDCTSRRALLDWSKLAESRLPLSTVFRRSDANELAEDLGEMALIGEPRGSCDVRQAAFSVTEQRFGPVKSSTEQILVGAAPGALLEEP